MMNDYEAKQAARRARLERAAGRASQESKRRFDTARDILAPIPPGQPILVGHHSEKRHRRALERHDSNMRAGIDAEDRAAELARRAEAVGTGGISSDDPDAVAKLKNELESLEAQQTRWKVLTSAWRKAGRPDPADEQGWSKVATVLGVSAADLSSVRLDMARFRHDQPVPSYRLSNNNGNMRRIRQRIETLTRQAAVREAAEARAAETGESANKETQCAGYRVVENLAANRVQVFFPAKPSREVCKLMSRNGYHFSRSEGNAWQRMLNSSAVSIVTEGYLRRELEQLLAQSATPAARPLGTGDALP